MKNSDIRRRAWSLCKANFGLILQATILFQLVSAAVQLLCDYCFPTYADTVVPVVEFFLAPVVTAGFLQFMMNIWTGRPAGLRDLLSHANRPLRVWAIQFAAGLLASVYTAVVVIVLAASLAVSWWLTVAVFIAAVTVGVMLLVLTVKLTPAMTAYILEPNRPASSCLRISLMAAKGNFWRILCHSIILAIPLMIATGLCNLLFRDGGLLHTIALALCTALCEGYMTLGTLGLSIHLLQNRE